MAKGNGSASMVDEAQKRLRRAKVARSFTKSANGAHIIKGIQEEVSALLREITDQRLDHESYLEKRAEVACLRKLLAGWASDANSVERYEKMYKERQVENARRIQFEQSTKT